MFRANAKFNNYKYIYIYRIIRNYMHLCLLIQSVIITSIVIGIAAI